MCKKNTTERPRKLLIIMRIPCRQTYDKKFISLKGTTTFDDCSKYKETYLGVFWNAMRSYVIVQPQAHGGR